MYTVADAIKRLQGKNPEETMCCILWHPEDAQDRAKEMREVTLTDEEADEVIRRMEHRHDCNIGINWEVMDYWIDEVLEKRKVSTSA